MAKLIILIAAIVYTTAEIVEKPDGIWSQRVSVGTPQVEAENLRSFWDWILNPSASQSSRDLEEDDERDSSEDGVVQGKKTTTCNCGWANRKKATRIAGGEFYAANEYPFIAGIATIEGRGGYSPFCGGSIITPNHVITAAHCTDPKLKARQSMAVLLGTHDRSAGNRNAVAIAVQTVKQHPNYETNAHTNDISILYLSQSIKYNTVIGAVCMPQPSLDVTSQTVRIIGWGAEVFKGFMTTRPKKLDATVSTPISCSRAWGGNVVANRPTQICTLSPNRQSACQGDSGGPVVYLDPETNRYTLVGLVSYGPECNDDRPTVHTKVTAYLPWIEKQIADTKPSSVCQKS